MLALPLLFINRRSPRANKYDGFKVPKITDVKRKQSKVKPIKVSSVYDKESNKEAAAHGSSTGADVAAPPPTPIATLQGIGIHLCGVPPEDLSPVKLLASPLEESDSQV